MRPPGCAGAGARGGDLKAWENLLDRLRAELGSRFDAPAAAAEPAGDDSPRGPGRRSGSQSPGGSRSRGGACGATVRTATSRVEALEALDLRLPAAVLIDTELPDGSGYALVERVRGIPGGETIAVLLVAGVANVLDRVEAIHCGADGSSKSRSTLSPSAAGCSS